MSPLLVQSLALIAFTSLAMGWDLRTRRIPNLLNVASLVLAIAFHVSLGGWAGCLFSLSGFATGFGILFILWLVGGGGGGDVKLMGAVGAWLGPQWTLMAFVASGVLTVLCLAATLVLGKKRDQVTGLQPVTKSQRIPTVSDGVPDQLQRQPHKLPYAVPVAMAVWGLMGLKLSLFYLQK